MGPDAQEPGAAYVVARAGEKLLALALADVVETMRPLPVSQLPDVPPFVLGVAVVRGAPAPVVDARALLGECASPRPAGRFVSLRQGARRAALAVDEVLGVRVLDAAAVAALPPLLEGVAAGLAESIATRDARLLLVLRAGRLVPDEVWRELAGESARGRPPHEA